MQQNILAVLEISAVETLSPTSHLSAGGNQDQSLLRSHLFKPWVCWQRARERHAGGCWDVEWRTWTASFSVLWSLEQMSHHLSLGSRFASFSLLEPPYEDVFASQFYSAKHWSADKQDTLYYDKPAIAAVGKFLWKASFPCGALFLPLVLPIQRAWICWPPGSGARYFF